MGKPDYDHVGGGRYDVYRKKQSSGWDTFFAWAVIIGIGFMVLSCAG